jgi:hypothetical protein
MVEKQENINQKKTEEEETKVKSNKIIKNYIFFISGINFIFTNVL